jgi:CrcB protein
VSDLAHTGWRATIPTVLAVGIGGIVGANLRWQVGEWAADRWATPFPWGTLVINLTGSFVLGLYLTLVTERFAGRPLTRLFFATGLLGAYTTFSTFAYETVRLLQDGHLVTAATYVAASLVFGLVASMAGIAVARMR